MNLFKRFRDERDAEIDQEAAEFLAEIDIGGPVTPPRRQPIALPAHASRPALPAPAPSEEEPC